MKRKVAGESAEDAHNLPKRFAQETNSTGDDIPSRFGDALFEVQTVDKYTAEYEASTPYKHAVVSAVINDSLLRSVRSEILEHVHFTSKETDIYKIHQSGDLANLDGLDPSALEKLPSLLKLRDALYSKEFRSWISQVYGAGPLSGRKTDMAVNVYVPGCHLLCHDDVIGSRRVSYILYLTDPDHPWQAEWGGALRLYSTDEHTGEDGKTYKVPQPTWSKSIAPAWNQLSFFAVQPGESFHDVEEVYYPSPVTATGDSDRVRMAISGWFHVPQEGEEGYVPGLEQQLAEKSSLQQLQGKADHLDEPQPLWFNPAGTSHGKGKQMQEAEEELTEAELELLLRFMTPNYLTPDTVDELCEIFTEESTLQLSNFLNSKFSGSLREFFDNRIAVSRLEDEMKTSRPPHKHRYQYLQPTTKPNADTSPYTELLDVLLPSLAFRKWLSLATGLTLEQCAVFARRFRRGLDYQLAQNYEGEEPQLEYTLCITPTSGWGGEDDAEQAEDGAESSEAAALGEKDGDGEDNVGGYEVYMAGEDVEEEDGDDHEGVPLPATVQSSTGAGERRSTKRMKADPAIYKAAADDEDDGILFSSPAGWNTLSMVLRDSGTLKFVKYVSAKAKGDRWDFTGAYAVEDHGDDDVSADADRDD